MARKLTKKFKARIVTQARECFRNLFPDVAENAACLYLTMCVVEVAAREGIHLIPQAGSASWPRIRPEQDNGVCCTHFSYMWEPNSPTTLMKLAMNELPEMHVWAADPQRNEIVDLTTGHIPQQCEELTGMDWPGDAPPDHLWCGVDGFPENTFYTPDIVACRFIGRVMMEVAEGRCM